MIWNEKIECASREDMGMIQSERLRETVNRIYHNVPYYRKKMQEVGLTAPIPSFLKFCAFES